MRGVSQDEALHQLAPVAEEHVLGAAQADALGTHTAGPGGVLGGVGVGAHVHTTGGVDVVHHPVDGTHEVVGLVGGGVDLALEVANHRGVHDRNLTEVDPAAGAVDGDDVALLDHLTVRCRQAPVLGVDVQLLGTTDAGLAHAAGDDGGVRGLAATAGEDALGGDHALEVVGVGLAAAEDDLLSAAGPLDGGVGVEDGLVLSRRHGDRSAPVWRDPIHTQQKRPSMNHRFSA